MRTFDWLSAVKLPYTAATKGNRLLVDVPTRHHTFDMLRKTPLLSTYRLFGTYQAEGSKSAGATDFSMANSNARLLAHVVKLLATWGLTRERLSLEVLRGASESPAAARAAFKRVNVEIVSERVRTGKGGHAGVLHVRKSMMLMRLTRNALAAVFKDEFPSKDAAREYLLGWLDGDGSIIARGSSIDLVLAGLADEHTVLKRALACAFGWVFEPGSFHKNTDDGTQITLRAHEMLDLIDACAFRFSMNRARLLVLFDRRTKKLRAVRAGAHAVGAFARWGLCKKGGGLTLRGKQICAGHDRHAAEIERARQLLAAAPKGIKGLPYDDKCV